MRFYLVFVLLFSSLLFSQDLVDTYRLKGISEVEKYLNKQLSSQEYWQNFFKDKDVSLGYYETKKYIILTQKKQKKLELFKNENHKFNKLFAQDVITGEYEGDKQIEGDKKTPIGVYDIVHKRENLDQFYGPLALVTSYPNTYDKSLNKEGHGIWIHGMPLNGDRELFTQGCIALDNDKLVQLDDYLNHDKTLLITSGSDITASSKEDLSKIMAMIYEWKYAWKISNFEKYINFYSKDFKRKNQSGFQQFYDYKKIIFSRDESKTIKLFNFDISPYPNEENKKLYRIMMDEIYKSPVVNFNGKKELIVSIENNEVKIVLED